VGVDLSQVFGTFCCVLEHEFAFWMNIVEFCNFFGVLKTWCSLGFAILV
jgi:hypothetical protein